MGHLWFHTFHLPLCATVTNSPLDQRNTRERWFTWANYTMCCTSISLPSGQTVSILFTSTSSISFSNCSNSVDLFIPPIHLDLTLSLIQSPHLSTSPSQTDILLSPGTLFTLFPFVLAPWVSYNWSHSSLSVQTCWQGPCCIYVRKENVDVGRKGQKAVKRNRGRAPEKSRHNCLCEGGCSLYKNGGEWNK